MGQARNMMDAEMLISRVVDGEARETDWSAFRTLAEADPTLWRELAEYQRDHAELAAAVQAAVASADAVEAGVGDEINRRFAERIKLAGSWGGWAAAAAIVLVWMTGRVGQQQPMAPYPSQQNIAAIGPAVQQPQPMTAADAFQTYLDKGQESGLVVQEVPTRVLLDWRPTKSGGYEVVYLRQIMERKQVRELNTWGADDVGRMVPVRLDVTPARPAGSF